MITTPFTFRLLAVRPLEGCKPWIRKCLQEDMLYYLCNTYTIKDVDGGMCVVERNPSQNQVRDDFYYIPNGNARNDVRINISAIVGMNGDGKSTLIELILRIINNYAFAHNFDPTGTLLHVEGVCAELFYLYNDGIFRIREDEKHQPSTLCRICNLDENGEPKPQDSPIQEVQDDGKAHKEFFYTLVSNYSHYAYNILDFQQERKDYPESNSENQDNYWLHKVFHKNDGYQVPLSLHPYRDKGNININREANLSMQRLLSLFVSEDNPVDNPSSFRRLNGKDATYIELTDVGYSKFQQRTLVDGLKSLRDIRLLTDDINNLEKLRADETLFQKELGNIDSSIYNTLRGISNLLIRYTMRYSLFSKIRDWVKKRPNKNEILPERSDLTEILTYFRQYNLDEYPEIKKLLKRINPYRQFNVAQIFLIHIIGTVCEELGRYAKIRFDKQFVSSLLKDYSNLTAIEKCEQYIIYKVMSIFETYPHYIPIRQQLQTFMSAYHKDERLLKGHTGSFSNKTNLDQLKSDWDAKTHITLKLRQTYKYMCALRSGDAMYEQFRENDDDKVIKINLDKLRDKYEKELTDLENMPPSIYTWDIIFVDTNNKEEIRMSQFSSGEKQRLNSLGAVIYHIRNIDSINDNDNKEIKYQAINLIFEEVELYFHPEWQRQYIKSLIDAIRGMKLQKVKAVNMIFATHSPFILSDIPKSNVLFLKQGKPDYCMQGNTFGANINSLLKNGFFMPTLPIGDFAYQKINSMFAKLNQGLFDKGELEKMRKDIMQVGEPYLRGQLLKLFKDYVIVVDNEHLMEAINRIVDHKVDERLGGESR